MSTLIAVIYKDDSTLSATSYIFIFCCVD